MDIVYDALWREAALKLVRSVYFEDIFLGIMIDDAYDTGDAILSLE